MHLLRAGAEPTGTLSLSHPLFLLEILFRRQIKSESGTQKENIGESFPKALVHGSLQRC